MVKRSSGNASSLFNQRSSFLTVFLLLLFSGIIARLFYLQVIQGSKILAQANAQHKIYKQLYPTRGQIELADNSSDIDTFPLAANLKSYLVYAVPQDITNPNLTANSLASVLGLESKDILEKITDTNKKYIPLKKKLTDAEQDQIKQLDLPGIFFDSEDTRFYPAGDLLSQTVGFVGYKGDSPRKVGLYGLERYFEKELAGELGSLSSETDNSGAQIFGLGSSGKPAVDGTNLILTIDKTIQFQAQSILKDAVVKNQADSGSVIVVDPKTGKILAMANYPDFNPNEFNKVEDPAFFNNIATTGSFEPGSTFKAITMAASINEGKVGPDSTYIDTGVVEVDGFKIKNSDLKAHGLQTMTQVLDESLNTGAIYAKEQIGNPTFLGYLQKFGFGQVTGVELPEAQGNLDGLKSNIKVNYDTASFGQGITATPLQLVQAYTAFANQGKMMKPYIVQSKIHSDGQIENTKPKQVSQVISAKTASTIGAMLVSVVENGHGKKAGVPGYYVAGKTGTAQVPKKNGKGYEDNINIGSFIGFAPVEDPRFVIMVRIDHPRDVNYAEVTAAPAWGQLAQFILNYYHIPPTRP
jgi:cell division protein FtsI/penicillin-binding protein 2